MKTKFNNSRRNIDIQIQKKHMNHQTDRQPTKNESKMETEKLWPIT